MSDIVALGPVALLSYFIGAVPFGYLVARSRGIDILHQGSGNIGATNVGRVLGRRFGILVFVFDFAKGALPVAAASWLTHWTSPALPPHTLAVAAGLSAFLGHLFPIYLRFRGGKGVATGAGAVAVLLPGPAVGAIIAWVAVLCALRYVSLASLAAAAAMCLLQIAGSSQPLGRDDGVLTMFCLVAGTLVFVRHRSNIARLARGTENRLKESESMLHLAKTIHVLAVGLWFGSAMFFTFSALVVFQSFESLALPQADRPSWLPAGFTKEQGTQLAGYAVGPIFPWYFLLQGVCGLLALATCWSWSSAEPQHRVHRIRFFILALALASVLAGWPLVQKVSALRSARYSTDTAIAAAAKEEFGRWHGYSLLLNFVTLGLVTAGMAMSARLPEQPKDPSVSTQGQPNGSG